MTTFKSNQLNMVFKSGLLACSVLAGIVMTNAPSNAQAVCPSGSTRFTTFLNTSNPCILGDKEFRVLRPVEPRLTDDIEITFLPNVDGYVYSFSGNREGPGEGLEIDYTLKILDPDNFFDEVALDSDVTRFRGGQTSVTKEVYTLNENGNGPGTLLTTLESLNGQQSGPVGFGNGGVREIYVLDTIDLDSNTSLQSVTNAYTQVPIPEPMTILGSFAVLGFGTILKSRKKR